MTNVLQPIGARLPQRPGADRPARPLRPGGRRRSPSAGPSTPRLIGRQMIDIGYYSLPVVGLTAIFTGMVLALQSYTGFSRFNAESAIPNVVVLSVTRELGPVLAGLMVAGRVGAAMAAEIGTMRVTEQIDALTTLSTNPMKYLVVPRLIAGLIMPAASGGDRRHHRRLRRLCRRHLQARLQPRRLSPQHHRLRDRSTWSPAWSRPRSSASSSR